LAHPAAQWVPSEENLGHHPSLGCNLAGASGGNVSDDGQDCRRHNNNNRLDTRAIQMWINDTVKANWEK
jgi:hypothetical protein